MLADAERAALEAARVGRLATADPRGRPHVVPVCFALLEPEGVPTLVTPIDEKPQAAAPAELPRVRNVRANPYVAVVVDRYTEDWDRLGWLQLRGTARLLGPDDAAHGAVVDALGHKYDQYADHELEARPAIAVELGSVNSWGDLSAIAGA